MDILAVVQEHAIESALTVLVVGILQGAVLARGVRNRFPKLKRHTRTVSAVFLILLTISAAINVVKFANPEKYEFVMPDNFTGETLAWAVFSLIGLDGSLASSVIIMLSVTVFLIFRTARMHTVTRYFIFTLSVVTFGVFLAARFTDFIPNVLHGQLLLYAAYQVGIALGAFAVSRNRRLSQKLARCILGWTIFLQILQR